MTRTKKAPHSKHLERNDGLHSQWKAIHMTRHNGTPSISPAEWKPYEGRFPRRRSKYWYDFSNWPSFVILDRSQIDKVLERFAMKDFPNRIPLHLVRRYIRNFDSEGYAVDSSLTAGVNWTSLPLNHNDLLLNPRKPDEDAGEVSGGTTCAAADTSACGGSSPVSTQTDAMSDSDRDNEIADEGLIEMATRANQLLSHEESRPQSNGDAMEEIRDTACGRPTVCLPAEPDAPCLAAQQSLNAARLHTLELDRRFETPNRQLGIITPPTSPSSTKGPTYLMKRLAEGPELRKEMKRLQTENEAQSEAMQEHVNANAELQNEINSYKEKLCSYWRAYDIKKRDVDSLQRENAALEEKLKKCADEKASGRNVLAILLFWLDKLYRDMAKNDGDEQDGFLDGIKADLGPQESDELLDLGEALCGV